LKVQHWKIWSYLKDLPDVSKEDFERPHLLEQFSEDLASTLFWRGMEDKRGLSTMAKKFNPAAFKILLADVWEVFKALATLAL
jgi:hypothetical protein